MMTSRDFRPAFRGVGLAAVFLFVVGLSFAFATDARAAQQARDLTIETKDGVALAATYYDGGDGAPGLVLFHMLGRNRNDWRDFAFACQEKGYHVLTVDLRGHGESTRAKGGRELRAENFNKSQFGKMTLDADAAVKWLAKQKGVDAGRIGIVGASIGANVALVYASKNPERVKTVVLLSPGESYRGIATGSAAAGYSGSALYIAAKGDVYSAKSVGRLATPAGPKKQKKIFSGNLHGTNLFKKHADLSGLLFEWFKKHLD